MNNLNLAEGITKIFSSLATSAVAIGFVFYGLGYIIVNTHLAQYGSRELNLLNPSYLPTGIFFAVVMFISSLFNIEATKTIDKRKSFPSKIVAVIMATLVSTGIIALFLVFAAANNYSGINWIYFGFISGTFFFFTYYAIQAHSEEGVLRLLLSGPPLLWMLTFVFLTTIFWGLLVYPDIKYEIGGGQPVTVQLALDVDTTHYQFTSQGISIINNMTDPVRMIYENDKDIVIALGSLIFRLGGKNLRSGMNKCFLVNPKGPRFSAEVPKVA